MSDLTFGIRITADGQVAITQARKVREGFDEIGEGAKRTSSALTTMGGVLGALQLDRLITEAIGAAKEMVAFAASLDDLTDITGSTVEDLSALANMAKFSGVSFSSVETALGQFSRRLSAADDDSKRMGAALRLLGIEARDPATAFREVAMRFDEYADGANKVALAQELFGREGARLLPLLKDLAREGEVGTRITTEQARAAEDLGKEINRLVLNFTALRDMLLSGVVPAMNEFLRMIREGGMAGMRAWLGITPQDKEEVGRALSETVAKLATLNEMREQLAKPTVTNKLNNWLFNDLNTLDAQIAVVEQRLKELQRLSKSTELPEFKAEAPTLGGRGGKAEKYKIEAQSLAAIQRELTKSWAEVTKQREEWIKQSEKWEDGEAKAWAAINRSVTAYEQQTKAIGATVDELEQLELARAAERRDLNELTVGAAKAEEAYEREAAAIRARYAAIRREDAKDAADVAHKDLLRATQEAEEEWTRSAAAIENSLTDALMRGFESGKDFAKALRDTMFNMFRTLVLRPMIQAVVAPVAGMFAGGASAGGFNPLSLLGGGGGGGFDLSSMVGGLGNFGSLSMAMGGASMAGGVGSQAAILAAQNAAFGAAGTGMTLGAMGAGGMAGGIGTFLGGMASPLTTIGAGLTAGMGGGMGAGLAAMGGIAGALGAAVPIIGIGLAIAAALGAFERGGPKSGGSASNIDGFGRFFTPNGADAAMAQIVDANTTAYQQMLDSLGGKGTAGFAAGFDEDPEGKAGSRVSFAATVDGRSVYSVNDRDVGRDEGAVQEALGLESKRALLAALQASELPAQIARVLNSVSVGGATAAQIDTLVAFGGAMRVALDAAKGGVGADAAKAYEAATQSVTTRLRDMGKELTKLAQEQDGSLVKMQALGIATAGFRQAVTEALVGIRLIGDAIADMIGATRETIEFAGLDNQAAYDLSRSRGNALLTELEATEDPAAVQTLAQRINGYLTQAFGLLSPEEQLAKKPEFLAGLDVLDTAVSTALARIGGAIEEGAKDPFATVNATLETATVKFDGAADKQASSANAFGAAVGRFEAAVVRLEQIRLTPGVPTTTEVGA